MRFVFFVPIAGSVVAMMVSTIIYLFALLSIGILVATKAENQMQALQMSMAFILPTTYFIDLVRAIILRGASFFEYWHSLGIMSVMAVLLFCICALRFRTKID